MKLDLRKYGQNFTRDHIYAELDAIGAQPEDIQYVTIAPGSSIPAYAFYSDRSYGDSVFPNLELVYNLNTCVSIGDYAFSHCYMLRNTDISKAFIDEYAFENCRFLTTVKLNPGIQLKQGTFHGCTSLTTVYNLNQCTALLNPENYESSGVFTGCQSLRNSDLSGCSHIGPFTFSDCRSLTSMKLASGVEIQDNAFYNCSNLNKVDNIKQCRYIGTYAFSKCGNLKNLDVSGAQYIGRGAFHDTSLETLKLGDAQIEPQDLNSDTLFGAAKGTLREVTIPSGWYVPSGMFSDCSNLEVVYNLAYATGIGDTAFGNCEKLSNSQLLSCSSIGDYAFMNCSAVAFSNLPTAPTIGSKAFYYCDGITKMTINGGTVGSDAFQCCGNLSKVTIVSAPVRDSAFADCRNLEKVELRGYTELGNGAFIYCPKLKEVTLSTEPFGIGAKCFADCSSLKKIYNLGVNTSISAIGSEFLSGVNLENNTIVASASVIDGNALVGCNMPEWNLPNITIYDLDAKGRFGAPDGTTFKCADGKTTTKHGENTMIWFDDGTCVGVKASGGELTRGDLVSASVMTQDYEWKKQPTRVVAADGCSGFGNDVFANCHKLSIVDMYSGSRVGERVFANCTSLKEISGDYVTYEGFADVGSYAFQGCTNLARIKLNTSNIHEGAFEGCVKLSSVSFDYISGGIVIESRAFAGCAGLKSITVPSTTAEIHDEAFAGSGLVTATIKGSEAFRNGTGQFKNCANLTKVTLPSSGCEIPNECFRNCNGLQTVYNLNKCTDIGDYAFFGCSALTNSDVSKCTSIGDSAFQGCSAITQIKVKSGASIGDNSFMGCGSIGTMYNLSYVGSIGDNALSGLSLSHNTIKALDSGLTSKSLSGCLNESWKLPNIYMSEAIAKNWYGANKDVVLKCKDGATVSDNQDSFTTINGTEKLLLKGVVDRSALEDAGYYPDSIDTIEFGTGVTSIGNNAFEGCYNLTGVTIGDNVTSIGSYAFNRCESLYNVGKQIGNNVIYIGQGAFSQTKIQDITLPASLSYIDDGIFYYCNQLTNIYVDSSNPNFKSENGLLLSKDGKILHEGVNGSDVYIPDGVEQIRPLAFGERMNLTYVVMPSTLKTIGSTAFEACGVTFIEIPNGVTSIGDFAFNNCSGLGGVTIPDSVTSIGSNAFYSCQHLGSIHIGNGVKSIGQYAFDSCEQIKFVKIPQLVLDIGLSSVFPDSYDKITQVEIVSGATSIPPGAFHNFSKLTDVTIPNSVTSIGWYAFENCTSLTTVVIPYGVTSIGDGVFNGCSSFIGVTIGNSVRSIGNSAFSGCSRLTSVTIPDSVTSIGNYAFADSGLTSVTFLGKTLEQVQGMENYSWGVDPSIIKVG